MWNNKTSSLWTGQRFSEINVVTGYYIHSNQKMRYKGTFRPQYVLDPESLSWDPLDGELAQKLDKRTYVSLSGDRLRDTNTNTNKDKENEAEAEINDEEVSLFDLHMPGVLTPDEVESLNLDHWLLMVHGTFVQMTVFPLSFCHFCQPRLTCGCDADDMYLRCRTCVDGRKCH